MKYLLLVISSFLAVALQMIASDNYPVFGYLDISLVLVAWWAVYYSRIQALFLGSFIGLILDYALGWPLGYNGFGRTLAAFIIGQTWNRFNTAEQPAVRFLIFATASLTSSASMLILFWITQRNTSRVFTGGAFLQALITAGAGLLFFFVLEKQKQS